MNEKKESLVKLGIWVLFVIVMIALFYTSSNNTTDDTLQTTEEEIHEFDTFDNMQSNIINGNYIFSYNITLGDVKYVYNGINCNNVISGYREIKDNVLKYRIVDNVVYLDNLEELEEINYLYEGIDSSFLNMELLFNNLKNYLYNVDKEEDVRTITYNKDGYGVVVKTDLEMITSINITTEEGVYNLEFTKVDVCDSISSN